MDSKNLFFYLFAYDKQFIDSASQAILENPNISCLGLIHGFTEGSLQTFVFLWSPVLQSLSSNSLSSVPGIDINGEPEYGLIFGSYMLFGVLGGYTKPWLVKRISCTLSSSNNRHVEQKY